MLTADAIKRRAHEIGFDVCGVAPAAAFPELARLPDWLASGYAGDMAYLARTADTRADVRRYLPSARSVIVTGTLYHVDSKADGSPEPGSARVARYARGADYHRVLSERLAELVGWMRAHADRSFEAAIFVDKHPVQERVYAQYAGVGWIGKNTCVINPELGSWLLLAGVACSVELDADPPATDLCGSCTICLDACPTGALVEPHVLDATQCISYLTIELHGSIPERLRPAVGDHLYGCDICQEVCPFNLASPSTNDVAWQPSPSRDRPSAADLFELDDAELRRHIDDSAMTYTSLSRLRRNLAVILGNAMLARSAAALDRPGHGIRNAAASATTPLVREHVEWAKARFEAPDDDRY
ncbi:MAG: tRNA epoxyqueuosine(34) reductase QueG [Acidobacteria bacterium]|nr:tRNA epoxyqueuosine(34) reductase QueG [Acidobacteriota bacterium]